MGGRANLSFLKIDQPGDCHAQMAEGDVMATHSAIVNAKGPACRAGSLCENHVALYEPHVRQRTCRRRKCFRICLPFRFDVIYECMGHIKERVISGQIPINFTLKSVRISANDLPKEEPNSPTMPPLETPDAATAHVARTPNTSCGVVSTGTTMGEISEELMELGGRRSVGIGSRHRDSHRSTESRPWAPTRHGYKPFDRQADMSGRDRFAHRRPLEISPNYLTSLIRFRFRPRQFICEIIVFMNT